MHNSIIPYLDYSEYEDTYRPNHSNTGNNFYVVPKSLNLQESLKKNTSYYGKHISEFDHINPEYDLNITYFNNKSNYYNLINSETKEILSNNRNNFIFTSNSIYLDDINYKKYMYNLKNGNNNGKTKKSINKKNNSQKKSSNYDYYNIIQIYEAPPLELTPIEEKENDNSIYEKKKPKFYRKKKIYSLEDNNINNKFENKFINLNYSLLDNSSQENILLKSLKSNNNSKNKKRIIDKNDNKKEKYKNENNNNNIKYLINEPKTKTKNILNENNSNNYCKKYIKKEKENKIKLKKNSHRNNKNNEDIKNKYKILENKIFNEEKYKECNNKKIIIKGNEDKDYKTEFYIKIKKNNKNEFNNINYNLIKEDKNKEKESKDKALIKENKNEYNNKDSIIKGDMKKGKENKNIIANTTRRETFDLKEKEIYKKFENKNNTQRYNYRGYINLNDNGQSNRKYTSDKKEKEENNKIYKEKIIKEEKIKEDKDKENKSKINEYKNEKFFKFYNIEIIRNKKFIENNKKISNLSEDKNKKDNILNNKEIPNKYFNINKKKDEKMIIKNILYKNNIDIKKEEEKKFNKNITDIKINKKEIEIKTPQQMTNRYSYKQIKIKDEYKNNIGLENSKINEKEKKDNSYNYDKKTKGNIILNIEVDKTQLSENKRTYLYNKLEKEVIPKQNNDKNDKNNNDFKNKTTKNNYSKKYINSSIAEKSVDNNNTNSRTKNYTERKKNEDIFNKSKLSEIVMSNNEEELKYNKLDFSLKLKNKNNNPKLEMFKNDMKKITENTLRKSNYKVKNIESGKNTEKRLNGLTTPNQHIRNIIEESKNIDINSFGNSTRKHIYNSNNNSCHNTDNKKENINNNKKNIKNNSKIKNISKNLKELNVPKKENNLKTIINTTHKNIYRNNHNYVAVKSYGSRRISNISQFKPMNTDKKEKINDIKKLNSEINNNNHLSTEGIPSVSIPNKIEPKKKIDNITNINNIHNNRHNNKRTTNDINNVNLNYNNNTTTNVCTQINISKYHAVRATSVKSVDVKSQNGKEDQTSKRKTNLDKVNNHSMKTSYGLMIFKFQSDKKESESKIANKGNINKSNETNNKIINNNINNINENKNNINNFINFEQNRRDTKAKNHHSVYISISSKKQ